MLLLLQNHHRRLEDCIRIQRDRINPLPDEECREIRMIRGSLPADADFALHLLRGFDDGAHHPLHRFVSFIVNMRDQV